MNCRSLCVVESVQEIKQMNLFNCGRAGVDAAVPDRSVSKNPIAYTGLLRSQKNHTELPVKAFLIRHPKGNILVDSEVRNHPIRTIAFRCERLSGFGRT